MHRRDATRTTPDRRLGGGPARVGASIVCLALLIGACAESDGDGTSDGAGDDAPATADAAAPSPEESTPTSDRPSDDVGLATAFWAAVAAGDREAASSLVDPAALDDEAGTDLSSSKGVLEVGRAWTLEGQFDWYEAVGWQWSVGECETTDQDGFVNCTATASNAWSDATGVAPITGTFRVEVSDDGITRVADLMDSFYGQYSPRVFGPFSSWVRRNHPEDALAMFDFSEDIDERGLALFEVNTRRFVDAQEDG